MGIVRAIHDGNVPMARRVLEATPADAVEIALVLALAIDAWMTDADTQLPWIFEQLNSPDTAP